MRLGELAEIITTSTPESGRCVISICGLAGVGKSTVAKVLVESNLVPGAVLQLDWYLKWPTPVRRQRIAEALESMDTQRIENEENSLNWYDWRQYETDLLHLRRTGEVVVANAWDQQTGEKDHDIEIAIGPNEFVVCDGMYLLHSPILELADLTVMIEAEDAVARKRADMRDSHRSSAEYLAYKQRLVDKYDIPYFKRYSSNAKIRATIEDVVDP